MVTRLKVGGNGYVFDEDGYYHEYVCDTVDDIASLPTGKNMAFDKNKPRPGSTAVVSDDASVYMLSNSREWQVFISGA